MATRLMTACAYCLAAPLSVHATNGDNLTGVGPISQAMGGVGIAAPKDGISAIVNLP
jgi:long-chain fatty acid transport protein